MIRHVVVLAGSLFQYYLALDRIQKDRKANSSIFFLILIMAIGILVNLGKDKSAIEMGYAAVSFLCAYIFLTTDSDQVVTDSMSRFTLSICILLTIIITILARSGVAYLSEDGKIMNGLTLGFTNPNLAGIMLSGIYNLLLVNRMKRIKIIRLICLFALAYYIYLTGARSALITIFFTTVYYYLLSHKRIPNIIVTAICVLPMIFPVIYVKAFRDLYQFDFLGKTFFTGREFIFIQCFEELRNPVRLLFGDMAFCFANAHNAPLTIIMTIGIIAATVAYIKMIAHLRKQNLQANSPISRTAIIAILGFYLQSSAEAYFFMGIFPGSVLVFIFTTLAKAETSQDYYIDMEQIRI